MDRFYGKQFPDRCHNTLPSGIPKCHIGFQSISEIYESDRSNPCYCSNHRSAYGIWLTITVGSVVL